MTRRIVGTLTTGWISALDPNVHFRAAAAKSYETTEAIGKPDWNLLFGFILARMSYLRFCGSYQQFISSLMIVISNLDNPDPSLQHWPAVAAWWPSRACMQGPASELCDVVYFRISQASGLIWSAPHGQAPLSLQLCVWFSLVSTLCSLTVTACQSRSSKLKIYGGKHSVYSIVGSLDRSNQQLGWGLELGPAGSINSVQTQRARGSPGHWTQCRSQRRVCCPAGI